MRILSRQGIESRNHQHTEMHQALSQDSIIHSQVRVESFQFFLFYSSFVGHYTRYCNTWHMVFNVIVVTFSNDTSYDYHPNLLLVHPNSRYRNKVQYIHNPTLSSWMNEIWMKIHLVSDSYCKIRIVMLNEFQKEWQIMLGLQLVLVTLYGRVTIIIEQDK